MENPPDKLIPDKIAIEHNVKLPDHVNVEHNFHGLEVLVEKLERVTDKVAWAGGIAMAWAVIITFLVVLLMMRRKQ